MGTHQWLEADFIVVGGGVAGCVVARRLADAIDGNVLLIEAGESLPAPFSTPLLGYIQGSHLMVPHMTQPQRGLGNRPVALPAARILGGGMAINAMIFVRGAASDFDGWKAAGASGWGYEDVLPYFKKFEDYQPWPAPDRGRGGPVGVTKREALNPYTELFLDACERAGFPRNADFNAGSQLGFGVLDLMQSHGQRSTTAGTYLADRPPNLVVLTNADVSRLVVEKKRVVGAELTWRGQRYIARASAEVIACAGALGSPRLLQLSGIGPAGVLTTAGIPVIADLPGVGENLQDHLHVQLPFMKGASMISRITAAFLTSNMIEAAYFAPLAATAEADVEILNNCFNPGPFPTVSLSPNLLTSRSRGHLRVANPDPHVPSAIDMGFLENEQDVEDLVRSVEICREIAGQHAPGALGGEVGPSADCRSPEAVRQFVRMAASTCYHYAGSCRMGTGEDAVVTPSLRCRGVDGLRVIDASIMPTLVRANTTAATIMIAEKGADLILGERRSGPDAARVPTRGADGRP